MPIDREFSFVLGIDTLSRNTICVDLLCIREGGGDMATNPPKGDGHRNGLSETGHRLTIL